MKSDEQFMKLLGIILKIGNCMNAGNKNRGQADGYHLDALQKTSSIKDGDGKSIMHTICKKMVEEDSSFMEFRSKFECCQDSIKRIVEDIKKDCETMEKDLKTSQDQFELIKKFDPETSEIMFGIQVEKFLQEAQTHVMEIHTSKE